MAKQMHAEADKVSADQALRLQRRRVSAAVGELDRIISDEAMWGRAKLASGEPIGATLAALRELEQRQP